MDDAKDVGTPFGVGEDFISIREQKSAGTSEIDFDGMLTPPLRLHEDVKEGCGGQLWAAGMVLAKYLLREPKLKHLRNKKMFVRTPGAYARCEGGKTDQ